MSEMKQVVPSWNGMAPVEKPSPEVVPKAQRRRFNAGYKLRILREVDACEKRGPKPNPEAQTIIAVQKKLADLLKSFEEDETGASS